MSDVLRIGALSKAAMADVFLWCFQQICHVTSRALSKVAMSDVLSSGALSEAVTSDREIAEEFSFPGNRNTTELL